MIRQRKPRIDLIGFSNNYVIVESVGAPNKWFGRCKFCNELHEQSGREIKRNQAPMSCLNYKPHNKLFEDKRDGIVRRQYGITLAEYEQMLRDQNNKCAICKNEDEVEGRRLAIDHCHESGNVRGLLCGKCNRGIGLFYDNKELLNNAISYLTKYALAR
jgi:hypothetical protein